jgi:hypothetical protein
MAAGSLSPMAMDNVSERYFCHPRECLGAVTLDTRRGLPSHVFGACELAVLTPPLVPPPHLRAAPLPSRPEGLTPGTPPSRSNFLPLHRSPGRMSNNRPRAT